jgi:hypothetical protein
MEKKAMLGPKVRRLRRDQGLTQAQMADQLGISPSYLNLIEHNQRPVTVPLLLKLGQQFGVDLQAFAEDEESRLVAGLREVFADPLFDGSDIKNQDFRELAAVAPTLGQAVVSLYRGFRGARDDLQALAERVADREKLHLVQATGFPQDEVRDLFQTHSNHFPELEAAAESLWQDGKLERGDLYRGLVDWLNTQHSVRVRLLPSEVMGYAVRRFDRHSRRILLSEMLAPSGRTFQLACQIALLRHRDLLNGIVDAANLSDDEARRLARIGLANYFAAAVLMPYARFHEAATQVRYDIEILRRRFDASFEQVCHRLTTLQRPNARGIPFFLLRVDNAGNVSKRFSSGTFPFSKFGGTCPLWNVHSTFDTPDRLLKQVIELPDGTRYFSIAQMVRRPVAPHPLPQPRFAIGLGCEIRHAARLVYAAGMDLEKAEGTPIGVNCRLCERENCAQRAEPPITRTLILDETTRRVSSFAFSNAREL